MLAEWKHDGWNNKWMAVLKAHFVSYMISYLGGMVPPTPLSVVLGFLAIFWMSLHVFCLSLTAMGCLPASKRAKAELPYYPLSGCLEHEVWNSVSDLIFSSGDLAIENKCRRSPKGGFSWGHERWQHQLLVHFDNAELYKWMKNRGYSIKVSLPYLSAFIFTKVGGPEWFCNSICKFLVHGIEK